MALSGDESGQAWDQISGYLYQLLAAIIKGNHTNCAQFANSNRLNWLFSRLGSQASSEGTGMLDVLHCVLIDSPEALNMMRVLTIFYDSTGNVFMTERSSRLIRFFFFRMNI